MASDRETIGVIGLGLMGAPMARNLAKAGYPLVLTNRTLDKARALADEIGAEALETPAEVARRAAVIIVMVVDTPAVEAVLHGPEGVIAALQPEALVIDMGTTAVDATRRLAQEVEQAGGHYVDAPVSGGQVGARDASLSIMAGGAEKDLDRSRPIFEVLGKRVTHVGEIGAGQVAKAANQMIVGLTIGAVAEAFALARAAGVDPAQVREALMGGFADSRILDLHGQRMASGDFTPGGKASTQLKDMRQAEALASELGLSLPALTLNRGLYERLIDRGDGGLDHSALIRLFDDTAAKA